MGCAFDARFTAKSPRAARPVGRALRSAALALAVLVATACGGDDDGMVDGDVQPDASADAGGQPDAKPDAEPGPYTSRCDDDTAPTAVVALINSTTDWIAVYRLEDGALHDTGFTYDSVVNPRRVSVRPDGREAVIAYGGFGNPYGVIVLSLSADATTAAFVDDVEVGTGQTPFGIGYASDDHVALATAGPDEGTLVALDRGGASFVVGPTMTIPGNWPLEVVGRPGHDELILTRARVGIDEATELFRVTRNGDGWQISGATGQVTPASLDIALHPNGVDVYSPASDPGDPVSVDNLDASGLLHRLAIGTDGLSANGTAAVPGISSIVGIHPLGRFVVLATSYYEEDVGSGTPIVRTFGLSTVPLSPDGRAGEALGPSPPVDVLLVNSLEVTASGHVVIARELYANEAPPGEEHPVTVWAQPSPGVWEECQTIFPAGAARLAIAP